ncbi:YiiD C-terminal domain-containing protein [Arenimonas sp.]|uniref:YiiD C-terminal domain-containing protein n=1 Tax=Arenimonas sp. TaxID=1872635 RepID=UPI0039E6257F
MDVPEIAADALAALNAEYEAMPPVAAMRIRAVAFDGERLRLLAPLANNVNDKGCAFGGSLASIMTLAGWGLAVLELRVAGLAAEVYVADSQIRYLAPLYDELRAEAGLVADQDWPAILQCLRQRGRARLNVHAQVNDAGGRAVATLEARFALIAPAGD